MQKTVDVLEKYHYFEQPRLLLSLLKESSLTPPRLLEYIQYNLNRRQCNELDNKYKPWTVAHITAIQSPTCNCLAKKREHYPVWALRNVSITAWDPTIDLPWLLHGLGQTNYYSGCHAINSKRYKHCRDKNRLTTSNCWHWSPPSVRLGRCLKSELKKARHQRLESVLDVIREDLGTYEETASK